MKLKTNRGLKKCMSFLLACILMVCMVPFTTVSAAETDEEYIINDSSFDMDDYMANAGNATVIKVSANLTGLGETVIQQPVTQLLGWTKNFFEDVPTVRTIKDSDDGTLHFASGVDVLVRDLIFNTVQPVVIDEGAKVRFENCTFVQTPINNGDIVCEDCTFETGKIENNGTAAFTGTTVEPENTAKPSHEALQITLTPEILPYAVVGEVYQQQLTVLVSGTNKDHALLQAAISPEGSGLQASVNAGIITVDGTAAKEGSYTLTVTATADGDEPVSKEVAVSVISESEYIIDDSSYDLDDYLGWAGAATTIKVSANLTGVGNTVIGQPIREFLGWNKSFFEDTAMVRTIKDTKDGSIRFASDVEVLVKDIVFNTAQPVVIEEGASVNFENCTFAETPINNGNIICKDCTFETGKIENNGTAVYTGSTTEPENIGTAQPTHIPLGMNVYPETLQDVVTGTEYNQTLTVELFGTNKDTASLQVEILPEGSGLTADVKDHTITVNGTANKVGIYAVSVTASAEGDESVTKTASVQVKENITVSLEGQLDAVTVGQSGYQDYLDVYVTEGTGEKINYYDYSLENPGAEISVNISPEDSGMHASYLFDNVAVSGIPEKQGTYQVVVTVTNGVQTATSNPVELRIYEDDKTLQERFDELSSELTTWDIEPYEISQSGNAVVPTNLKNIYGSHESGLYAILGNNQGYATDTLTIPAGCDVTFENVKFYSSIQIIVEEGGSLTLKDSVAYGPVVVNGGTFSMSHYAALVDSLTLNDGSVLEDATVDSNGRYLTDGSDKPDAPAVVIVNGAVTALGNNSITGEPGDSVLAGQDALVINGELMIPEGSTLTVQGGGDYAPAFVGGNGIVLHDGKVTGKGTLIALGGHGYEGNGGAGITGEGVISVGYLESTGGDAKSLFGDPAQGGDAVGPKVIVTTENYQLKGGAGNPEGSAVITLTSADKEALKESIQYAEDRLQSVVYDYATETMRTSFEHALNVAKEIVGSRIVTQKEVDVANSALMKATHQLNFSSLQGLVDIASGYDLTQYVEPGKIAFESALHAAKELLKEQDSAQTSALAEAAQNLFNTMSQLTQKADKAELEDIISQAKALDENAYTKESYDALKVVIAEAEDILADENIDQDTVNTMVEKMKTAIDNLILVSTTGTEEKPDQSGSTSSNDTKKDNVNTGDATSAVAAIGLIALSGAVLFTSRKRR